MVDTISIDEILQTRFDSLPFMLQSKISDPLFSRSCGEIAVRYKFSSEGLTALKEEVLSVLYGFEPFSKLEARIQSRIPTLTQRDAHLVFEELRWGFLYGLTDIFETVEHESGFVSLRESVQSSLSDTEVEREIPTATITTPNVPALNLNPAPVPEAPKDLPEKLELRPSSPIVSGAPQVDSGVVRPLTREEVLNSIAPARTMARDIASLPPEPPRTDV